MALAAGLITTAMPATAVSDATSPTGTHIKKSEAADLLQLTVIDRETIELSGKTSVADLLRDLPFNTFGSPRPQSGSSRQSFAGLSLRGLGVGRTLILLDGRRLPVAPNTGEGQNLNVVPLAAVERIEILPAGASAIYGSDAMGGVVNIITRKQFTGVELTAGISETTRTGGETEEGSFVFGAADDHGRVMAGVSYNSRDIVFARDREWSRGGASIFANNFLNTNFTFFEHPEFGSANLPGCQGPGFSIGREGSMTRCFYDTTLESADEAAIRNESLFFRASYDIADDWTIFANGAVSRVKSFGRETPVPSAPWPVTQRFTGDPGIIVLQPGSPNHPATPPDEGGLNPNWSAYQAAADDTLLLTHRFAANGPRDTSTKGTTYDLDLGVQGPIGGFDIELGFRRVESQHFELGRNYIVSALAQPQIDSGAYDIYRSFAVPQDVLDSFTATISRNARTFENKAYAIANTNLPVDVGGGPVALAFGGEYRDEAYKDVYGDLRVNGNITGADGSSAFADRDKSALFGEILFPLIHGLHLSGGVRHDDYSDFGSSTSSKLALRWQPAHHLTVRASWWKGFRAPPLSIVGIQPSFSEAHVVHQPTAEFLGVEDLPEALTIDTYSTANPELDSELSDSISLGVAFEPLEWLRGSVDLWRIEVDERMVPIHPQQILNCLEGLTRSCPPGLSRFPAGSAQPDSNLGLGAEFGDQGQIIFLQSGIGNLGGIRSDGADINLRTRFELGSGRNLFQNLQATYTHRFEVDGGEDVAGDVGGPKWRAALSNVYRIGDFALSWNINHIGDQESSLALGQEGSLPSWTTHDVQANWYTSWDGRITLGIDNLANEDPVLDEGELRGFNFELYDGYGRLVYLRYRQNW